MNEFFQKLKIQNPLDNPEVPEMTVEDLKGKLDAGEELFLLDVRETVEHELARLDGATLIPLAELVERWQELDAKASTVVFCKAGGRSARAVRFLRAKGFGRVWNLSGGIDAWSERVDPAVPRY